MKHSGKAPVFRFEKESLLQIALPLGGIGAGCVCLNGYGGIQNFSIRNRPSVGPLADRFQDRDAAFALLHIRGAKPVTRLVEGPFPPEKIFNQGLHGNGYVQGRYEGLPRFQRAAFEGAYPFGTVQLSDPAIPLKVEVTGWSPFIPLDDVASGIPGAILEYTFHNSGKKKSTSIFPMSYPILLPEPIARRQVRATKSSRAEASICSTMNPLEVNIVVAPA